MFKLIKSVAKSIRTTVANDPEVDKFVVRHSKLFGFIKKRLDPDAKFGLNLTIGIAIALLFLYFFFGIIWDIIGNDAIARSDIRIINLLQIFRTPNFTKTMLFITYLGNWQVVFLGAALASFILLLLKKRQHVVALVASVVGGEFLVASSKILFHRLRPPLLNAIIQENGYSFPSGHSLVSVTFYGIIGYFIFKSVRSKLAKVATFLGTILIISLIGFSRMYLGVHYPTDVLGGHVAGLAWVTAVITALEIRLKSKPYSAADSYSKKQRIVAFSLISFILWASFLLFFYKGHPVKQPRMVLENETIIYQSEIPDKLFANYSKTSEDITGEPMEPINIIVVGDQKILDEAFRKAGWVLADKISLRSLYRISVSALTGKSYPEAPGTPSFWNTRPNDFAYEKQVGGKVSEREHIHFWQTPFVIKETNQRAWFATAHFDKNIVLKKSWLPTHEIDPAVDKEREKIKDELQQTGEIRAVNKFQLVESTLGRNQAGSKFFTDGLAYYIYLK